MQKMSRDRFRRALKEKKAGINPPEAEVCEWPKMRCFHGTPRRSFTKHSQVPEVELCMQLATALSVAKGDKRLEAQIWEEQWASVYALAEAVMSRTIKEF